MDRANPYAPPEAEGAPRRAVRSTLRHLRLKYVYVVSLLAPFPLTFLLVGMPSAAVAVGLVSFSCMVVAGVVSMLWVHATWSLLSDREMDGVSPARAVTNYFIPFYNLYWSFEQNARVVAGLQRKLGKVQTLRRAPTVLAWLTPATTLGSLVLSFLVVGNPRSAPMLLPLMYVPPVLAAVWMFRVDGCHEEIRIRRKIKRNKNHPA